MFVDSHCHLSFPELLPRVDEILAAMSEACVERALCICTTLEEAETVLALAARDERLFATVGVHPDSEDVREPTPADLVALARRPRVVGIGETGLDYYRLNGRSVAQMQWQRDRFVAHIQAARATGLLTVRGNAAAEQVIAATRPAAANLAIVAIPQALEAGEVIAKLKAISPNLSVLARAHSEVEVRHLLAHGADAAMLAERELAFALRDMVLAMPPWRALRTQPGVQPV